ncbi:MAG: hypothetical protein IPJ85_14690 [Flavobacteriales bacterium]|nr:hypothetical protein [Flavobacteriales bacterium]
MLSLAIGWRAPFKVNWNDGATELERPAQAGVCSSRPATDANGCPVSAELTVGSGPRRWQPPARWY